MSRYFFDFDDVPDRCGMTMPSADTACVEALISMPEYVSEVLERDGGRVEVTCRIREMRVRPFPARSSSLCMSKTQTARSFCRRSSCLDWLRQATSAEPGRRLDCLMSLDWHARVAEGRSINFSSDLSGPDAVIYVKAENDDFNRKRRAAFGQASAVASAALELNDQDADENLASAIVHKPLDALGF